jgi:hypothetical protein
MERIVMKPQWMLLWVLLLSVGIGIRAADVDLDNLFSDDSSDTDDAAEVVTDEAEAEMDAEVEVDAEVDADLDAEVEDMDADLDEAEAEETAEVDAPQPAAVPEPTLAAPEAEAAAATTEDESPSIGYRLAMWLPNRLVDLDDIISVGLGCGAKIAVEPSVTRFFQFGGSYGDQYFITKGYSRQYGGGFESGWGTEAFCWSREKRYVEDTFGLVQPYLHYQETCSISTYSMDIYKEDKRDLWAIGIDAGWLLSANAYVHPLEIADFLTGIVLYDLSKDDF